MRFQRAKTLLAGIALAAGWVVALPAAVEAAVPVGPWSSLNSGTSDLLNSISCPGSGTCYAVGANGTIIVTRDGGASWARLASGTSNRLDSISCPAVLTCFVAGPFPPVLLVTTDGGATWLDKSSFAPQPLAAISCADVSTCVAVGIVGTVVRTSDGGATWSTTNAPTGSFLLGVSCPTTTTCFAVGAAGVVIVRSTDGGASWSDVTPATDHGFLDIVCPSATSCLAVGGRDRIDQGDAIIMTTSDGGTTWVNRASNTTSHLFGVTCFGASDCFVVGGFGTVLASDNGGATWSPQVLSSTYGSLSVACLSNTVCFAVGGFGAVIASPAGPRTVTNANDSGSGSLRAAIDYANGHPGLDTITFGIGNGPHSIALQSGLPAITDPAVIDASTQPGYAGAPIIELNGGSAGGANGLTLLAGSTAVRGFVINHFLGFGVRIESGGGDIVAANYIGTDMTGTAPGPNFSNGIVVFGPSTGNLIGGPTAADRNVISGNLDKAIVIVGGGGATIAGNFIGVDVTGTHSLPNRFWGVALDPGNDSTITGNVISGNGLSGILIANGSHGNVVERNLIGTDAAGTASLGNLAEGVVVADSSNNTIGGGNVISANARDGIAIYGVQSTHNLVVGNLIGTDVAGSHALGNAGVGVAVHGGDHNTIGGSGAQSRNVVSGNSLGGILIGGDSNTVAGNYVGVDRPGTSALGNGNDGVFIYTGSSNVIADRNVISGNALNGVNLGGPGTTGTIVQGNYIGTDATGHSAIGNVLNGVVVSASPNNVIGGGNLLSGNLNSGVLVYGDTGTGNLIQGNLIGTDASGNNALPNQWWGVVLDGAHSDTIGGASESGRNVVSGNTYDGILVNNTYSNLIQNNYIGLGVDGTTTVPNQGAGIFLHQSGDITVGGWGRNVIAGNGQNGIGLFNAHGSHIQGNYIGTDRLGLNPRPNHAFGIALTDSNHATILGNVISGNAFDGVYVQGSASDHATVQGNFIGTDASGHVGLGNGGSGVTLESAADTLIGGTSVSARNVISGNGFSGIYMFGYEPAARNVVQGNYVGTDVTGTVGIGNAFDGIQIINGSANIVGGTAPGAGNLVSGNSENGVDLLYGTTNTVVQGNLIGTDRTGTVAIGNQLGVDIDTSSGTLVGGATSDARNVISGNTGDGLLVFGDTATGNLIQGNYIGPNVNGAPMTSNQCNAVMVDANAGHNSFAGNLIAYNNCNGVAVGSGVSNSIRGNSIHSNGAMGIDLNNDGVTLNDRGDRDGGANNSQNFPVLSRVVGSPGRLVIEGSIDTPNPQNVTIEIYANASPDPGADYTGYGEGQTLIGTVKPNAAGRFSVVLPAVPKGTVISATATDAQGNTSEFAQDKVA